MRTKLIFCGIVATAFIVATIILVSSCSQDDDYYESDKYTMAEKLETRAGESGGGGTPIPNDTLYTQYEFTFEYAPSSPYPAYPFTTLIDVKLYRKDGEPVAKVLSYGYPVYATPISCDGTLGTPEIFFTPNDANPFVYNMCANASIGDTVYVGMVENILFH